MSVPIKLQFKANLQNCWTVSLIHSNISSILFSDIDIIYQLLYSRNAKDSQVRIAAYAKFQTSL